MIEWDLRVIAASTLRRFVASLKGRIDQRAVEANLEAWNEEVLRASWKTSADIKRQYSTASILNSERVVFNIKGNDYRLVTAIDYQRQIVFIKWIGTHKQYDKIDAVTVRHEP